MRDDQVYGHCEQITGLLNSLKELLPELPGFRSLSLYGSLAEGRADEYSDIDLIVMTDNVVDAKEQVLGVLERVGPIEFSWLMNLSSDEWNPTVVFLDQSYYHKLDLVLVGASAEHSVASSEQTVPLCDEPRVPVEVDGRSTAYAPEHGSMGHFLLGQMIGCTRYLKARRRGQTMTCYRFAAAAVDWHLALTYARLVGDPHFRSKLSTIEYRELDSLMPADHLSAIAASFDFSDGPAMDRTLLAAAERLLEDGSNLAAMTGESLPIDVFSRLTMFLTEELQPT